MCRALIQARMCRAKGIGNVDPCPVLICRIVVTVCDDGTLCSGLETCQFGWVLLFILIMC